MTQPRPLFTFDQELLDVEELLLQFRPADSQLQDLYDSTEVEVDIDPVDKEGRDHRINPVPEPELTESTLLKRSDAHPNVIALILFEHYNQDWLTWDVEALDAEVTSAFGEPHPVNVGKIAAVQAAYTKTAAWDEWHYFVFTCQAFNNEMVDPVTFRPPTVAEAAICCTCLKLVDDKVPWSEEVKLFLGQVLRYEHFLYPPDELSFASVGQIPSFDKKKVEHMRKHVQQADETVEGYFARRLHNYDVDLMLMRKRLASQLQVLKRRK